MAEKTTDKRKTVRILRIILIVIIVLNLCIMFLEKNTDAEFINKLPITILPIYGNSMAPQLKHGDAVMAVQKDYENLKIGDIVIFYRDGELIAHEIIDKVDSGIITKGVANDVDDGVVSSDEYKLKVLFKIPLLGGLWRIYDSPFKTIILILLLGLLLFGDEILPRVYDKIFDGKQDEKQ